MFGIPLSRDGHDRVVSIKAKECGVERVLCAGFPACTPPKYEVGKLASFGRYASLGV